LKSILITGASGFIGKSIFNHLKKYDYTIKCISKSCVDDKHYSSIDLLDNTKVKNFFIDFGPFDVIIHCAAIAHGQIPPNNLSVYDCNTTITKNLIDADNSKKSHWIFMSSISIYDYDEENHSIPIKLSPSSNDQYGKGKLIDEKLLLNNINHLDILRLMPVYDKNNLKDLKKRIFIPNTTIKLMIHPSPLYNLCHIKQIKDKVYDCMQQKNGKNIHQVGDINQTSQIQLSKMVHGFGIVFPRFFFKIIIFLIPPLSKKLRSLKILIKKFVFPNKYAVGVLRLDK